MIISAADNIKQIEQRSDTTTTTKNHASITEKSLVNNKEKHIIYKMASDDEAVDQLRPPPQPRRKISLPWFKQSSFGLGSGKPRLPKQYTIATETPRSPPPVYHNLFHSSRVRNLNPKLDHLLIFSIAGSQPCRDDVGPVGRDLVESGRAEREPRSAGRDPGVADSLDGLELNVGLHGLLEVDVDLVDWSGGHGARESVGRIWQ